MLAGDEEAEVEEAEEEEADLEEAEEGVEAEDSLMEPQPLTLMILAGVTLPLNGGPYLQKRWLNAEPPEHHHPITPDLAQLHLSP